MKNNASKDGIALVIVLGFLIILVLLGVSFAVLMRTERLSARNYADMVAAQHLAEAAITRATVDLDTYMISNNLVASPLAYGSRGGPLLRTAGDSVMMGTASNYVPWSLVGTVESESDNVEWVNIFDPLTGDLLGRVAYLLVDCSGFIDANTVTSPAPRTVGSNGWEIQVGEVSELQGNSVATFVDEREQTYRRFETYDELTNLVDRSALMSGPVKNFFVYSRFLPMVRWDTGVLTDPVDINTAGDPEVEGIFTLCNIPNAAAVVQNLRDYMDVDLVPNAMGPGAFSTEPVPVINEVILSNRVTVVVDAGGPGINSYTHDVYLNVETWFPFPYAVKGNPGVQFQVAMAAGTPTFTAAPAPWAPPVLVAPGPAPFSPTPYGMNLSEFHYRQGPVLAPPPPGLAFRADISGIDVQYVDGGNAVVDSIAGAAGAPFISITLAIAGAPANGAGVTKGLSVTDPRMNGDSAQWSPVTATPMGTNGNATGLGEGVSEMFVRNGPLESPAELGYLSVGNPWETIALYDTRVNARQPVLDYFYVDGTTQTGAVKGLVNPNSVMPDVLAAPFLRCPIEKYPGDNDFSGTPVSWAEAKLLGQDLANLTASANYYNSSDIGVATSAFVTTPSFEWTDARIESVLRNSYRLFNVRENLWTVFVMAQAVVDGDGNKVVDESKGEVVAEQRAMAVVWHDPYPSGTHASQPVAASDWEAPFIRFFRWMTAE